MYARFQKDSLETVGEVNYTNSLRFNAKPKLLSLKGRNSVENNFIITKTPHAHFHYVHKQYTRLQKDPLKTVGRVDYTNSIPLSVTNGRTDRRTDRANLTNPDYSHGGIKSQGLWYLLMPIQKRGSKEPLPPYNIMSPFWF